MKEKGKILVFQPLQKYELSFFVSKMDKNKKLLFNSLLNFSLGKICIFFLMSLLLACFVQITTKLNYTAFYHYEDVALFQKKPCKHELISQHVQERP